MGRKMKILGASMTLLVGMLSVTMVASGADPTAPPTAASPGDSPPTAAKTDPNPTGDIARDPASDPASDPAPAPAPPTPAEQKKADDHRARDLYLLGDDFYSRGRYQAAIEMFKRSYELSGRQLLKYNIANAYERLGNRADAIRYLEDYLPHSASSERVSIENRVLALKQRYAAELEAEKARLALVQPVPHRDAPMSTQEIAGYGLLIGGGVGVAVGAVFGVVSLTAGSAARAGCREGVCSTDAVGDLDLQQVTANGADVAFALGFSAAAVGLVLVLAAPDDDVDGTRVEAAASFRPTRLQFTPTLGGTVATMSFEF